MRSSIANTTFSFLQTISKFRSAIPEDHRPSWVKITTITMISKMVANIDIHSLRDRMEVLGPVIIRDKRRPDSKGIEWNLRATTFYNQITLSYMDAYSTKSVKVFPNGSIQVAGCSNLFDCKRVIGQLTVLIKTISGSKEDIKADDFRVVMINTNFSLNYNLNLFATAEHFGADPMFNVTFDPDRYSAVKIKFKPALDMKQVTTSIFSTGKIIVTGAETLKEIAYAFNIINQHMLASPDVKTDKVLTPDVFGVFMGYQVDDFIKYLDKNNVKPWTFIKSNFKIKF